MNHSTFGWKRSLGRALFTGLIALSAVAHVGTASADSDSAGVVYTSTNAVAGNEIAVFRRAADGALTAAGRVATTGLGTGGGLGNQGALAMSGNDRWLFAVNAGSNDISTFAVNDGTLSLVGKTASGGVQPVSVTAHDDLLYVLNAGGTNNITGFMIGKNGQLTPIANSTRLLSAAATGPAQVEFSPDGETLIVTEKMTNKIDLFAVEDGIASGPVVRNSIGMTPFGFAFDKRGRLFVSEAFAGAANASAVSSYHVDEDDGVLSVISPSVGTKQTAACWVVVTKNGRYAYTTNTASGSISGYSIDRDGKLALLNADGRTAVIGAGNGTTDAALTGNSKFLYVLNAAVGTLNGFRVQADGSLTPAAAMGGLAARATGLIAR